MIVYPSGCRCLVSKKTFHCYNLHGTDFHILGWIVILYLMLDYRLFIVFPNCVKDSMDVDGTSRVTEDQKTNSEKLSLSSKKLSDANAKTRGQLGGPKKTMRCRNCVGCLTPECKVCTACK